MSGARLDDRYRTPGDRDPEIVREDIAWLRRWGTPDHEIGRRLGIDLEAMERATERRNFRHAQRAREAGAA